MTNPVIKQASYANTSDSIQGAFKYSSHENIAVTATDAPSSAQTEGVVILCSNDYYRLEFNAVADVTSMLMPPGNSALLLNSGDILHFIRTENNCSLSIIVPE